MRLGRRYVRNVLRWLTLGALSFVVLAGCTSNTMGDRPSTTTTVAFTHAQVLSWVTPSLGNGISFAESVPPTATPEQMFAASRPISAAASVSLHELAEVSWLGALRQREKDLVKALTQIEKLTAAAPGPSFLNQLDEDIQSAQRALRTLSRAVTG